MYRRLMLFFVVLGSLLLIFPQAAPVAAAEACYSLTATVTNLSSRQLGFEPAYWDADTLDELAYGSAVIVDPGQTRTGNLQATIDETDLYGIWIWFVDAVEDWDLPTEGVDFVVEYVVSLCEEAGEVEGTSVREIQDGRLNSRDIAALVAVYRSRSSEGGLDIYAIDPETGRGTFALTITAEELATAKDTCTSEGANALVAEVGTASLWVIEPCNQLQLNSFYSDGNPSVVQFALP